MINYGKAPRCRGVAQPGSASGLGPEGREFESLRPDHFQSHTWLLFINRFVVLGDAQVDTNWPGVTSHLLTVAGCGRFDFQIGAQPFGVMIF